MQFADFDEHEEYTPAGHAGVVNRLLAGRENWDLGAVSIWHGRLEPGGHAEPHDHPGSVQLYVGLSGELTVGNGSQERTLRTLSTVLFDAGEPHFVENRSDDMAELLVISSPSLR
ncbi:MAG: cupin domain-containing protein [Acidimicrobiia bacterium]|nr:cupin domain-containing protein [Acidimicrobiia bacterium]